MSLSFPQQILVPDQQIQIIGAAFGESTILPRMDIGDWDYVHVRAQHTTGNATVIDGCVVLGFAWTWDEDPNLGGATDEVILSASDQWPGIKPQQQINMPVRGRWCRIRAVSWPSGPLDETGWRISVMVSRRTQPLPLHSPSRFNNTNPSQVQATLNSVPMLTVSNVGQSGFYGTGNISAFYLGTAAGNIVDFTVGYLDRANNRRRLYAERFQGAGSFNRTFTVVFPTGVPWVQVAKQDAAGAAVAELYLTPAIPHHLGV